MGTMGLGICSEYSRSRIPKPPQNRTTFISILPQCAAPELSGMVQGAGGAKGTLVGDRRQPERERRSFALPELIDRPEGRRPGRSGLLGYPERQDEGDAAERHARNPGPVDPGCEREHRYEKRRDETSGAAAGPSAESHQLPAGAVL